MATASRALRWLGGGACAVVASRVAAAALSSPTTSVSEGSLGTSAADTPLYPPCEPFRTGWMRTADNEHQIYFEECGNPNGKPALFLHGGPAAGFAPVHRRFFDPRTYRIVLLDQRSAGKSKPSASLTNNTTWHLVADLEQLREHLNIEAWHTVYGGSWGSTLALAYAQSHPSRVKSMVLRGVFLFGRADMNWLFQKGGASDFFPEAFERYESLVSESERGDLLAAYYRRLTSGDTRTELKAASHFVGWETSISRLRPLSQADLDTELADPSFILPFARAEAHYFIHGGWFERDNQLLEDCDRIAHIPVSIIHGRYDMVCRPRMAYELHRRLPLSTLEFPEDAGHSGTEPATLRATLRALDRFGQMSL
mmetsp:Transcript_7774/g.19852  ORF Transcript_7774/g.19852 Transcript_7774/m.19852 type:complete len:368 (-) Transcript_7774:136-1239(-)